MSRASLLFPLFGLFVASSAVAQGTDSSTVAPTLAVPPRLLEVVQAELPADVRFPGPEVIVLLSIEVDETGQVKSATVTAGAGEPFDSAAQAAAGKFRFEPARLSTGDAVPVTVTFRMRIVPPAVPTPVPEPEPPPDPVQVSGRLIEKGTRRPIPAIEVVALVDGFLTAETISDADGRFTLQTATSTQTLSFILRASAPGFESVDAEIVASPGEQIERTYYLTATGSPYETIVRAKAVRRAVVKRTITRREVDRVAGTTGDAIKVVQNLPGVSRTPFEGGPPVLRGASPGDSQTFLESHQIPQIYHFGGLRSTFNSGFLDAVDFVPGNFGPEFGRATGGVIDVRVRDPADDLLRGLVDVNLYDASILLEGPVSDEVSVGGAFRRSYIDSILPAVIPDDAPVSFDTAPRFYDYQFLATWKPSRTHTLRAIWYGSRDRVEILFDDPQDDPTVRGALTTKIGFHNVHLSSEARLSSKLTQDLSVQTGIQSFDFALGDDFFFDLTLRVASLRGTWTAEVAKNLTLRGGVDTQIANADIKISAPFPPKEGEDPPPPSLTPTLSLDTTFNRVNPAGFVEARFRPIEALEIVPSLRADYYSAIEAFTIDPRLLVDYALVEDVHLKAGLGLYQQQPEPDESSAAFGNPDLSPERSIQASLGSSQRLFDVVELDVTGFYKWLDKQVVRNTDSFVDPEAPPYLNSGEGRIFGLELLLRARTESGFFGWIAYTFQRSFRTDRPGTPGGERRFDFDQPHLLTAVASYDIGAGWTIGGRFRLISGTPDTPVVGSIYDSFSDVYVPVFGENNIERLATFHQLDIRIDKLWTFDTWTLDFYADIQNIYNNQNQEGWVYRFDFLDRTPLNGLPVLPILGLKGQW